jgi:ankyrin repeat protein
MPDKNITDKNNKTLLMRVSTKNAIQSLLYLLQYGADPLKTNNLDQNALHNICLTAQNEFDFSIDDRYICSAIKLLISYGANINHKDSCGKTPLDYTCGKNALRKIHNISITRIYIESGYDIQNISDVNDPDIQSYLDAIQSYDNAYNKGVSVDTLYNCITDKHKDTYIKRQYARGRYKNAL